MIKTKYNSSQRYNILALVATTTLLSGVTAPAFAQVGEATRTADPARVQEQFLEKIEVPDISSKVEVKETTSQDAPAGAENITLTLSTIELEGVSAYSNGELESIYAQEVGQNITLADIYDIARDMTNKYRNDGYILTQVIVPPQTIEGGLVKLRVIEGYINDVTIEGESNERALKVIRKYAGHIQTNAALNTRDLERYLLLINDLPGVKARSVLSPSPTETGAADLRIIIERNPHDVLLAVDNFGSRYLGPINFSAAGSLNSFFGNNERITLQTVYTPNGGLNPELAYGMLSYAQPIFENGTLIELLASHTATQPGFNLDQFNVKGKSRVFSANVTHPFVRSRSFNISGRFGFDWRDMTSKNDLEPTREDKIRALRAGGRIEALDTLLGFGLNSLDMQISQGVATFGASKKGDANLSRPSANPQFTKLNAELQRLQRLSSDLNLMISAKGQISSGALLSSEEFGVGGGTTYGRGYDPSEIIGDQGIAGKLELQWNEPYKSSNLSDYQFFSFVDAGRVWNDDATTSALKRESLSSAGFGVRADITPETKTGLSIAFPLSRDVGARGDRNPRVYFNLSRKF